MKEICFATNNQHKLEEVRHALAPDFRVLSLAEIGCHEELPETGATLEANARQKADYVFTKFSISCFADDTGLEVEALGNEPGVYSARYAGPQRNSEHNIDLLLAHLKTQPNKHARFRTVICWMSNTETRLFEGRVEGTIVNERRGTAGFGYDPVFVPAGYVNTFAEMAMAEKNKLSHRARAVQKLVDFLQQSSAL
jgi:XTP/dITP diphosphohydrolase